MPRVWIVPEDFEYTLHLEEHEDGLPVDMNASLFRQIVAANKKFHKFQSIVDKFYTEAWTHPGSVRRVR